MRNILNVRSLASCFWVCAVSSFWKDRASGGRSVSSGRFESSSGDVVFVFDKLRAVGVTTDAGGEASFLIECERQSISLSCGVGV